MSDQEDREEFEVPLQDEPQGLHRRGGGARGRGRGAAHGAAHQAAQGADGRVFDEEEDQPAQVRVLSNLLKASNLDNESRLLCNDIIHGFIQTQAEKDTLISQLQRMAARAEPAPHRDHAGGDHRAEEKLERQVDRFWRKAPRYTTGSESSWADFMKLFNVSAARVNDEEERKLMLYGCLQGKAQSLAVQKMYPFDAENQALSFEVYSNKLRDLFEPVSESENAKLEFTERQQHMGENPTFYYQRKLALFERAWPVAMRDMRYFYDEVTKGLTNELMKSQLWSFEPTSPDDYEKRMTYLAAVVQKRYRAREISEAQVLGAETTIQGYAPGNGFQPFIKQEPGVHAMAEENAVCYHCRKKGHFARNCPRKLAGLTPPAAAVEEDKEETDEVDEEKEEEEINFVRNGRAFRGKPYRFQRSSRNNRFTNNRFTNNRSNNNNPKLNSRPMDRRPNMDRIGVVYEDENGEQFLQEDEPEDTPDEEAINTLQLEEMQDTEDHSEADFVPYPFLGSTASNQQN